MATDGNGEQIIAERQKYYRFICPSTDKECMFKLTVDPILLDVEKNPADTLFEPVVLVR